MRTASQVSGGARSPATQVRNRAATRRSIGRRNDVPVGEAGPES
ncbi:hypothetical protein [Salinispora sp. H7-4]|nr:hypothetical protein [Salinispora sp. H7-4]